MNSTIFVQYFHIELLPISLLLYLIGNGLKTIRWFPNPWIPKALLLLSLGLTGLYVGCTLTLDKTIWEYGIVIVDALVQSLYNAALAVFLDQIIKQHQERKRK